MKRNLLNLDNLFSGREVNVTARREAIKSFKAKANAKRSTAEKFADWLTAYFGSVFFLGINAVWFLIWITINTGLMPGIEPFDPFPFGLLTMMVSLEAIFLAIIVLISQNRESRIGEVREEVDLQLNMLSEGEVTKVIKMLTILMEKQGIDVEHDKELRAMLKPFNEENVEKQIEKELDS